VKLFLLEHDDLLEDEGSVQSRAHLVREVQELKRRARL
jgi:hypothetical protein